MSSNMIPIETPPDSFGRKLLLESPADLEFYIQKLIKQEEHTQKELDFYQDFGLKKKHLSSLYDPPEPSSLEILDYRLWIEDLCKEDYRYWKMRDRRVPVPVQQILGLWYDFYGNVDYDKKCRANVPKGSMDYFLTCSHTKPETYKNDYTYAKNFFKHIHFIYDYIEKKASYIIKNYQFLSLPENKDLKEEKIIKAYQFFKLSPSKRKSHRELSRTFNISLSSIEDRSKIDIDLSRDPVETIEEMYDSLKCTPSETHFISTGRKATQNESLKFSSKFRVPKGTPPHVIRSLRLDTSNPSV